MMESLEYKGVRWKSYQGSLVPDEPADQEIELSKEEGKELMRKSGASLIRYTSHFDNPKEDCFWYVIKDQASSMEDLSSNTRNQLRKGMKCCEVEKVSKDELAEKGYAVYERAFQRYSGNHRPFSKELFQSRIRSLDENQWDFWKVTEKNTGEMIAYSRNKDFGHCCNLIEIKLDPSYLKSYPSYVLFFRMSQYYLEECGYNFINNGARSISHETRIQEMLIKKFHFRKAHCRLNVFYRPWLGVAVKSLYPLRPLLPKKSSGKTAALKTLLDQEAILKCQRKR